MYYLYNLKMMSKQLFLFVLILLGSCQAQLLKSITNCLGNCTSCNPLNLASCQGSQPCEWGFYDPSANGTCRQTPSTETVAIELGERSNNSVNLVATGWNQFAKQSQCQYSSSVGTKYIDALGFYSGVEMLEKTFAVDPSSSVMELSFNLLHDEWLPFNDFLIIDLSSNSENIETLEVSFDSVVSINSQTAKITCEGKQVISQKFSFKFFPKQISENITIIFTSFLFNAVWGITNLKLTQGCTGYSRLNSTSQKCDQCDTDAFVVSYSQSAWCQKCPSLCATCSSVTKCLTCLQGAALNASNLCSFGEQFKTQLMLINSSQGLCDGWPVLKGSLSSSISFP
jgi:hypothetical protein